MFNILNILPIDFPSKKGIYIFKWLILGVVILVGSTWGGQKFGALNMNLEHLQWLNIIRLHYITIEQLLTILDLLAWILVFAKT